MDDPNDYAPEPWQQSWAGFVPIGVVPGQPLTDATVTEGVKPPRSVWR
jgi:hypothetical protein